MVKIDLGELRKISRQCTDNQKTQEYVRDVCYKIRALLINYAQSTKKAENKVLEKYMGHHYNNTGNVREGQISPKHIKEAIEKGNMRERLTLITNFCMNGCSVILWAVDNKKHNHITRESIDMIHRRLYNFTGLKDITKINKYINVKDNDSKNNAKAKANTSIVPCKLFSLALESSVAASRMATYFNAQILRIPRAKRLSKYLQNVKDVYPTLSARELLYIKENARDAGNARDASNASDPTSAIKNNILPWISGLQYWEVNESNFYVKLMRHNKQMVVCGPSGNTDLVLSILRLFDNFNIDLAIFACVSQLCNAPHHSPCEILLASLPYGLSDWTIDEDAFKYIKRKLK